MTANEDDWIRPVIDPTPLVDPRVRRLGTDELTAAEVDALRALLWEAFESDEDPFTEDDWEHALGGRHFLLEQDGRVVAHAAVVEREIVVAGRPLRTGYVEAVAVAPSLQGRGFGTAVMREATAYVRGRFELGVLGTGSHHFYERLGWIRWRGPSSVLTPDGLRPTPDDDGFLMVLPTRSTPALDPTDPIVCGWRPGAVW